jgi:hypothetical protein
MPPFFGGINPAKELRDFALAERYKIKSVPVAQLDRAPAF